jgi:hypothetical protein
VTRRGRLGRHLRLVEVLGTLDLPPRIGAVHPSEDDLSQGPIGRSRISRRARSMDEHVQMGGRTSSSSLGGCSDWTTSREQGTP